MGAVKKVVIALTTALLVFGVAAPAHAIDVQWKGAVRFEGTSRGELWDTKGDDRPVRAEYGRSNGTEYLLSNTLGNDHSTKGPSMDSPITWALLCVDYSAGDDCSDRMSN